MNIRVDNPTQHDITLKGRTTLGHLQQVRLVTPLEVKLKDKTSTSVANSSKTDTPDHCTDEGSMSCNGEPCGFIPNIDTEELTEE